MATALSPTSSRGEEVAGVAGYNQKYATYRGKMLAISTDYERIAAKCQVLVDLSKTVKRRTKYEAHNCEKELRCLEKLGISHTEATIGACIRIGETDLADFPRVDAKTKQPILDADGQPTTYTIPEVRDHFKALDKQFQAKIATSIMSMRSICMEYATQQAEDQERTRQAQLAAGDGDDFEGYLQKP